MNPFRDTIVASPWNATLADISEIHHSVEQACLEGLERVRSQRRSASLLIHGEAGSGKTHLLSRIRARLTPQAPIATDRRESLFVWVRLQTSPRMIWRTLRRTLIEDWFRPVDNGRPQIDRILFHRLAALRPAEWDLEPWYEYMLDEDPQGLESLLEQISQQLNLDHNLAVAFQHIAFGRYRRELRAWLCGTSLPDTVLERLELAREDGTEEELEEHAKQLVLMLCRLTGPELPILLSFDQVEALQTRPGDDEALFTFGQTISTLHDGTSNVLLVSSVQSAFAEELAKRVRGADYDRMTSLGKDSLAPLKQEQALRLINARLEAAGIPRPEEPGVPESWPLDQEEFESLFVQSNLTARRLLNLCAERYDHPSQSVELPQNNSEQISVFLQDQLDKEFVQKAQINSPDRTEEIVQHGLPLVVDLLASKAQLVQDQELPDVSLIFETNHGKLGLSVCTQSNMTSLFHRLRRLKSQHSLKRLDRLVLIRDDRVPVSPGAKSARKLLDELEEVRVSSIFPSVEALAALDALRDLLSNAKAGDLSLNGETIPPQTVGEWLRVHLPRPLRDLSEEVLGSLVDPEQPQDPKIRQREAINAMLMENPVRSIADLAQELNVTEEEAARITEQFPEQFGLLGNPVATVFLRTEQVEAS